MNFYWKDIRTSPYHEIRLGCKATEAVGDISISMGEHVVSYDTAKCWFQVLKERTFILEDETYPRRPSVIDYEIWKQLYEEDSRLTRHELAERLQYCHSAVYNQLHQLGKVWKKGQWVPHELRTVQCKVVEDWCLQNLTAHRHFEFLRNLIRGDDKWLFYVIVSMSAQNRKESWGQYLNLIKKILLNVWLRMLGVIYWEIYP